MGVILPLREWVARTSEHRGWQMWVFSGGRAVKGIAK